MRISSAIVAFYCLLSFASFGQELDSLILGAWTWKDQGDETVMLKRSKSGSFISASITINDNDTMYRTLITPKCGMTPRKRKFSTVRGPWSIDELGFLEIEYEILEYRRVKERFEVIEFSERKILLKKLEYNEIDITGQ